MSKIFRTILSLLATGSVFFCGTGGCVKSGVRVNGEDIGDLPYAAAEERVRSVLPCASFTVATPEGEAVFPLDCSESLSRLVRRAKRNENLVYEAEPQWVTAEQDIAELCRRCCFDPTDATVVFTKAGEFFYTPEKEGRCCLYEQSLRLALAALREGKRSSALVTEPLKPKITVAMLKKRTQPLASFTTWFDGENIARTHNIALACTRIMGTALPAGGRFSFNEVVGKRTEENGFRVASVIFDGEFVPGVGGGVCQVSSTLMNCAVRAGLKITCSRPHSLSVSYVPPSCDAMVSDYSDLEFYNPHPYPVYLAATTGKNYVKFVIYGMSDGRRYALESKTLFRLAPPPEKVVEGDEEKIVREGKEGVASESYLLVYEGEKLVSRTLFRRDTYAARQGIKQIARPAEQGASENEKNFP